MRTRAGSSSTPLALDDAPHLAPLCPGGPGKPLDREEVAQRIVTRGEADSVCLHPHDASLDRLVASRGSTDAAHVGSPALGAGAAAVDHRSSG